MNVCRGMLVDIWREGAREQGRGRDQVGGSKQGTDGEKVRGGWRGEGGGGERELGWTEGWRYGKTE